MRRMTWLMATLACGILCAQGQTSYTPWEIRVQGQIDASNTEDSQVAGLLGAGYSPVEGFVAGLYGSYFTSDRAYPAKVSDVWGIGGYVEYDLTLGYTIIPFIGASVGILEPSGPGSPTILELTGSGGARLYLTENVALSAALTLHWADEEFYDYEMTTATEWEAEEYDITGDLGIRFYF